MPPPGASGVAGVADGFPFGTGSRGLHRAELGVEEANPRARALYERLGYLAYDRKPEAWDEEAADGSITRYETVCTLMGKQLP